MKNILKRVVLVLSCMIVYMFFVSQSTIDTFIDDFTSDKTHKNAAYENYNIINGDLNSLSNYPECPDSTVFFIANRQKPLVAKYNIYNASHITVSFYSSFGSFATKNKFGFPFYYLGYTNNSDNSTMYPVYLYDRRLYTVDNNNVYTGFDDSDEWGINYFRNFNGSPDVSDLINKLGVNISVSDGENSLSYVDVSLDNVQYIASAGLYYHTVSAIIPDNTEYVSVSLWDIDQIFDDNNIPISHKQNYYSAIANVTIKGNDLKLSNSVPRDVSGSTLPFYPDIKPKSSSSTNSQNSSNSSSKEGMSSYVNDDNSYSQQSRQTYAKRIAPNVGYSSQLGQVVRSYSGDDTEIINPNWGGTNVLQFVPESSDVAEVSSEETVQSSSISVSSYVQTVPQTDNGTTVEKNKFVIPTIIISAFCIITTQVVIYFLRKPKM